MKHITILISLLSLLGTAYAQQSLNLRIQKGYGPFQFSYGGVTNYALQTKEPWKSMQLKTQGVPEEWQNVKYGDIETNIYQSVYQAYHEGKVDEETYSAMKASWDWEPKAEDFSKSPIKTKVAFAFTTDSNELVHIIVDANNNLDFSDDESFHPLELPIADELNKDSVALSHAFEVKVEQLFNGVIEEKTVSISLAYLKKYGMFMSNFPNYFIAELDGQQIGVCSNNFTNMLYRKPSIALLSDTLNAGEKINPDALIEYKEYLEVNGKIYQNRGVNLADQQLKLFPIEKSKSELYSSQIGYPAFPFNGELFQEDSMVSLNDYKGKYVLLDFWATWCKPCLQEIPHLKALYEKTDRSEFEIISIVGESPVESLQKIIQNEHLVWPQILSNEENQIVETYGIQGYPTTYLLDPKGMIVAKDLRGEELEKIIAKLLADNKD